MDVLNASSRVALAALVHDLGKLAQRADLPFPAEKKETHIQLYCPHHPEGNWWSHHHAAYTALAFDVIEQNAPALIRGEMTPFASRDASEGEITDSLVNAAAMHHCPKTLMQWIIATADRMASGFEREEFEKYNDNGGNREEVAGTGKNHFQARQLTLFEQIRLAEEKGEPLTPGSLKWRYPLKPLSPESLFPVKREGYEPDNNETAKKEYAALWEAFREGLEKIPDSHRQAWPLWLDHFDTAWLTYTHAVPSATAFGTRPDVSLYDHSKATAALAVALWRYHLCHPCDDNEAIRKIADRTAEGDWDTDKFLLIQGDFFGIQDFIFAEGSQTNRQAAKLLRGRSFYVSLLTELAALKILEALELPSTSQIINAAGKFLIVAENSPETEARLKCVREELNQWFLDNTYGMAGIGLAWQTASSNDFLKGKNPDGGFSGLVKKLFEALETAKLQQFSLCGQASPVLPIGEFSAPCQWHGNLPADGKGNSDSCALSRDQIMIGKQLTREGKRILILKVEDEEAIRTDNLDLCELPVFGYRVAFTGDAQQSGKFAGLVSGGVLRRCWDCSLPQDMHSVLWHGYARRNINGYVPRFDWEDRQEEGKYAGVTDEEDADWRNSGIKPFGHIACENRQQLMDGKWAGQVALVTLKGDVDNLGNIFRRGLHNPERKQHYSFARMAALSRQLNNFFAVWLPAKCVAERDYANTYTVFAGGDDFFMIGPWRNTQRLAGEIAARFRAYTAENPEIHLSAGMIMSKPGYPVHALAEAAEDALAEAKRRDGKNAACLFRQTVCWDDWAKLEDAEARIDALGADYSLSTGYLYSLFSLIDMAETANRPEASLWRSKLAYRTARTLASDGRLTPEARQHAHRAIVTDIGEKGIAAFKGAYRIPLFNYFYRKR